MSNGSRQTRKPNDQINNANKRDPIPVPLPRPIIGKKNTNTIKIVGETTISTTTATAVIDNYVEISNYNFINRWEIKEAKRLSNRVIA